MTFLCPKPEHRQQLLALWKESFGEHNGFWELFLETAFSPVRCRCVWENGQITAALTWMDCTCGSQRLAYLYAVATGSHHRGKGLCRSLLADTHALLKSQGYTAAILVPGDRDLRSMYRRMGYRDCTRVREFTCQAAPEGLPLRAIGPTEYAALRRLLLPKGGVIQEGPSLAFLARQAQFYTGPNILLAAYQEGDTLITMELLGNPDAAPAILRALKCTTGHFRTPGAQLPFAMCYPLALDFQEPVYFGFAFD